MMRFRGKCQAGTVHSANLPLAHNHHQLRDTTLATQAEESPWAECKVCWLCGRRQEDPASCEMEDKVLEVLEKRDRRAPFGEMAVCKCCCIAALGGHGCPWWDLCWRD